MRWASPPRWRPLPAVLAVSAALLLGADVAALFTRSRDTAPNARPRPQPARRAVGPFTVARAKVSSVPVYDSPASATPRMRLSHPNEIGAPRVFLVKEQRPGWLHVLLPVRPNGSKGWVREADVSLTRHSYRVRVELAAHRITVWNGDVMVLQEPVGIGRANAPTPSGEYYLTELLRPPNPGGVYGAYAFGLSGFSEVFQTFAGGPGTLGLHGTNDPAGIGKDVSSGCIRMSNPGITKLAFMLPLGTPVEVVA